MKEVIIRYNNPKTLQVLKNIAKYFDFSKSSARNSKTGKSKKLEYIKGIPYIPGNASVDITELSEIFTGKNINAKELRINEWQRQK